MVSEEESAADAETYVCETCPVADALAALDDDAANREAWAVFHRCVTRFTVDAHLAAVALSAAVKDWETDDVLDLIDRLGILYNAICPPPVTRPE